VPKAEKGVTYKRNAPVATPERCNWICNDNRPWDSVNGPYDACQRFDLDAIDLGEALTSFDRPFSFDARHPATSLRLTDRVSLPSPSSSRAGAGTAERETAF
jgi:hypothetical protein